MRSSRATMRSAAIDDLDAITPCPPCETQQESTKEPQQALQMLHACSNSTASDSARTSRSASPAVEDEITLPYSSTASSTTNSQTAPGSDDFGRKKRRRSVEVLENGTNGDPARLWQRMLALQQAYGCYKSARMSAALSSGDASLLLPSKACLDLMNEHMSALPDDVDLTLDQNWQANA